MERIKSKEVKLRRSMLLFLETQSMRKEDKRKAVYRGMENGMDTTKKWSRWKVLSWEIGADWTFMEKISGTRV